MIVREKLVKAYEDDLLNDNDLIDFGKEEAVDYFLGEKTTKIAYISYIVAIIDMILARKPALILDNVSFILAEDIIVKSASTKSFWGDTLLLGFNENNFNERLFKRVDLPYFKYSSTEDIFDLGIDLLFCHKMDGSLKNLKNVKKIYFGLNLFSNDYYYFNIVILDNITRFFTNIERLYLKLIKKDKKILNKMRVRYSNIDFFKEYIREMINISIKKMNDDQNI